MPSFSAEVPGNLPTESWTECWAIWQPKLFCARALWSSSPKLFRRTVFFTVFFCGSPASLRHSFHGRRTTQNDHGQNDGKSMRSSFHRWSRNRQTLLGRVLTDSLLSSSTGGDRRHQPSEGTAKRPFSPSSSLQFGVCSNLRVSHNVLLEGLFARC